MWHTLICQSKCQVLFYLTEVPLYMLLSFVCTAALWNINFIISVRNKYCSSIALHTPSTVVLSLIDPSLQLFKPIHQCWVEFLHQSSSTGEEDSSTFGMIIICKAWSNYSILSEIQGLVDAVVWLHWTSDNTRILISHLFRPGIKLGSTAWKSRVPYIPIDWSISQISRPPDIELFFKKI